MSEAVEDYLKAIYKLHVGSGKVSTSALAGQMRVTPPSVTSMVKSLAELGLLRHDRYHGVELTEAGARAALEVIRHHRLWELFLTEALEVPLERVHEEAEKLEHILSDDLEEHLDRALGHPTIDPHGDPIPSKDGTLGPEQRHTLADLDPTTLARVERVPDSDPALLHYLCEIGLVPGARVRVVDRAPFGGPYFLEVQGKDGSLDAPASRVIGRELAMRIFVAVIPASPKLDQAGVPG
jgi:DtxR family Mn-dependent transcriptional regulator